MLELNDVSFGALFHDRITGAKGKATAKVEYENGVKSVCLEGVDTTGRPYSEWTNLDRLEADA